MKPAKAGNKPFYADYTSPMMTSNRWRRSWGAAALILALILMSTAAMLFWRVKPEPVVPDGTPWNFYLAGLAALVGGVLLLTATPVKLEKPPLLLLLILLLAFGIRLYHFPDAPYGVWGDEAEAGLSARHILNESDYRPIYNGSLHMTYVQMWMYAGLLAVFGDTSILALRVLSVLFGVGAVFLGYHVGKQIHSPSFGLWMAFFLAIMRWSLTFSRLAITGIETPFFALLTLYLLIRLMRRPSPLNAVLLGFGVGGGLLFYMAYRLIVAGLFVVALLHWRRKAIPYFFLVGIVTMMVIFPMLIFADTNPDVFLRRQRDTFIGNLVPDVYPSLEKAIYENAKTYVSMFHIQGDGWSLYNYRNVPMLDPVMGVLMILGLAFALVRIRQIENQFFLVTLITGLAAGVLTVSEAHSGRTVGVVIVVAYLCTLGLFGVKELIERFYHSLPEQVPLAAGLLLGAAALVLNFTAYFNGYAHNYEGWILSARNRVIADELLRYPPEDYRLIVSNSTFSHNPIFFIEPDLFPHLEGVEIAGLFPLYTEAQKSFYIVLGRKDIWAVDYVRMLYPNAEITTPNLNRFRLEGDIPDIPFMFGVRLRPEDIKSLQGLDEQGRGFLYVRQTGEYRFLVPSDAAITLDGVTLVPPETVLGLNVGLHTLETTHPLQWQPPGTSNYYPVPSHALYHAPVGVMGLRGYFYPNPDWEGIPASDRVDPTPYTYFHEIPLARPYTARWVGCLQVPADGDYEITVETVGYAEVNINGEQILAAATEDGQVGAIRTLQTGQIPIEIRYRDTQDYSALYVQWRPLTQGDLMPLSPVLLSPDVEACQ